MRLRARLRRWRRRRRWEKAARESSDLLREFVYLDEVSVYSLLASKQGMIATEMSASQASTLQSDVSGSVSASTGFAKTEVGSRLQATDSRNTQVLRKAIIQSTFKDLHSRVQDSFSLRTPDPKVDPPKISSLQHLESSQSDGSWIVDAENLERGRLVEARVLLESEPLFQARTVMSGVLEIIEDNPAFFGINDLTGIGQAAVMSRMLDKLLVGLVPVRGRAVDYLVIRCQNGRELVVHKDVLEQEEFGLDRRPFHLVGVAEEALFWKDIRRVVFSGSTYNVLARIGRSSLHDSWTPLKLVDALARVAPNLADAMELVNQSILPALAEGAANAEAQGAGGLSRLALSKYAFLLADHVGIQITEQDLESRSLLDAANDLGAESSVEQWRRAFEPITLLVEEKANLQIDKTVASQLRLTARLEAGLHQLAPGSSEAGAAPEAAAEEPHKARLLDTEIIAIYW